MEELEASQNQITPTHSMHLLAIKDLTKSCGTFLREVFKTTRGYKMLTLTFHILNPFDILKSLILEDSRIMLKRFMFQDKSQITKSLTTNKKPIIG